MCRTQRTSSARGFTLLEIIVVVTIIALLATMVAPRLIGNIDKAKVALAKAEVNTIAREVNIYLVDHNQSAPDDDFELTLLTTGDRPPFRPDDLIDPWEHDYGLLVPGEIDPVFNIVSYGSDGQSGGEGYAADIYDN